MYLGIGKDKNIAAEGITLQEAYQPIRVVPNIPTYR